jgi:hypothetical protein
MRWVEANEDMAFDVGFALREQDREEVKLSHGLDGLEAVLDSYLYSDICRGIEGDDGTVVGLTGLCGDRIWLLGTEGLTATKSHRWQLCAHGREWVEYCLRHVGAPIGNYVYAKNLRSIKWLRSLGFTVLPPAPLGPGCSLFCEFWRTV